VLAVEERVVVVPVVSSSPGLQEAITSPKMMSKINDHNLEEKDLGKIIIVENIIYLISTLAIPFILETPTS